MPRKTKTAGEKDLRFEDAMGRLEKTVQRLEEDDLSLEESLKLFEDGVALCRVCRVKLDAVQKRIEVLSQEAGGKLSLSPLDEDEE
jgi:exodeoxyribonuclease VII small subunit